MLGEHAVFGGAKGDWRVRLEPNGDSYAGRGFGHDGSSWVMLAATVATSLVAVGSGV